MSSNVPGGRLARVDPEAESTDPDLPPFIAVPPGAPAYYGFPVLQGSEIDGFTFGVITDPNDEAGATWGDAYVIAPNGSRAGIVWQAGAGDPTVICPPSEGRWGVYGFAFQDPIRSDQDLIAALHSVLPNLKEYYAVASRECPESTRPFPPESAA